MNEVTLKIKTVLDSKGLQQAVKEIDGVKSATQQAGAVAQKSNGLFSNFYGSLLRIAKLRMLRGIIRALTQAFKEGTENIYQYSVALGSADASHFATTMNELASSFLYLKNSIGAVVAPLLSALLPALQTIVSWVALALDYLAQFFAVINGQSTYTKAKKTATAWKEVGGAASGAAAAAKEYKNTVMSFDELHLLNDTPNSGGGGGGGGASAPNYTDMFEEVELPRNIFTALGELFSKDGILGKGIKFMSDTLSFAIEGISPALSLLWGMLTGDINMCKQAWDDLQKAISNNKTAQTMLNRGMKVYKWVSQAIDDVKWMFLNSVEDIVSFLSPVLELFGIDVDEITEQIEEQKRKIVDHRNETEKAVRWFELWTQGMSEESAAMVVAIESGGKATKTAAEIAINALKNEKKEVGNVKDATYQGKDAWGVYASAVTNLNNMNPAFQGIKNGIDGTATSAYNATYWVNTLSGAVDALRKGASTAVTVAINAINSVSKADGGFVQSFAGGGVKNISSADIFLANENGSAELIGSIGNRTAVANQGQMIEAMATGVRLALSDMMSQGNSNTEVIVNMDGETVARAVDRGNKSLNRRFSVSLA